MDTKRLLRLAAGPLLPGAVCAGPKRGSAPPRLPGSAGRCSGWRGRLCTETLNRQGFFRPQAVQAILERHVARRGDESRPLWALLAFTLWYDAHVASPAAQPPSVDAPFAPVPSLTA